MERSWVVKTKRSLELAAQKSLLTPLLDVFTGDLKRENCPESKIEAIRICVEEIFVNIASYAYPDREGQIQIEEEMADKSIHLTFIDEGIPYNPLEREDPDVTLPAGDRKSGGLGIYLVKQMADEVRFEYKDNKNCLYMECSW